MKTKHEKLVRDEILNLLVGSEGRNRAFGEFGGNPETNTRESLRTDLTVRGLTVPPLTFNRVLRELKKEGLLVVAKTGAVSLSTTGLTTLEPQITERVANWKPVIDDMRPRVEAEQKAAAEKAAAKTKVQVVQMCEQIGL
jgi:hypothetical protein